MIYFLVILLGLVLDQASKWLVSSSLPLGASFELVPIVLNIHYVRNTGAAWSLFSNSTLGLAIFSLLMLVVLGIWFWKTPADRQGQRMALCLMISGAVGNMIDRFRLGYVVDFLELPHWPVFNVADMLLCCGVALLAILLLWEEKNLRAAEKNQKIKD
jgi:signal peptidase II